ncbi:hypothetical protein SASPL_123388 [Salvia splendens]|uniref:Protein kinase domain-containing protein n=1 Tax=Salvia splendens TaxID=180675 RepID=A0A8X8ZS09_SALSN|nr:hypothetical protein SASPL_123388 [Salvia splendens]
MDSFALSAQSRSFGSNTFSRSPSLVFLALHGNNLTGAIPDFSAFQLQSLTLDRNFFTGTLPSDLFRFSNLSVLSLSYNRFTGEIPAAIGNLSSLKELDLSHNAFTGQIPYSFNISYNNLSGFVPLKLAQKFNSSAFVGNLELCGYTGSDCVAPPPSQAPPPPASEKRRRKLSNKDIILIAAGALLVILQITCFVLLCCLLRRENRTGGKLVHFDGPMVFGANDLLCATAEIMGKSTYGTVYKATMEDGIQVAVKRLRQKITKGQREFEIEVNALVKIRHPNLLALRAYYLGPKGEKLLVFYYMPKGSLATFLHARAPDTRMNIAKGMTRGLLYLHTNVGINHGNLTSSNVLLDEHANAKIADYSLARLMTAAANANVIATAGALGYGAPELSKLKKASTKSDVYSLGVIVLELLTGKSPGSGEGVDLPQWVASIVEWTNEVFDLELMRDASVIGDELLNTLKLALHCVDPTPSTRPEAHQIL